jgi:acyl-CoA synthetase (AMP-forming)/AMP-acid ligase II
MQPSLTSSLARACAIRGEQVALKDGDQSWTWNQLSERITRLAGAYRALGLQPGDRVATLALNGHRYFETYFATLWAGGIMMPLNHRLTGQELISQLRHGEPRLLMSDQNFHGQARALKLDCADLVHIHASSSVCPPAFNDHDMLIENTAPIKDAGRCGQDIASLFFTGGTTGAAKAVMLSHLNLFANSMNIIPAVALGEDTVHLHAGPLFHVAAASRLFSVTQVAGTHVMLDKFDAQRVIQTIEANAVTVATFVPTMLAALLNEPGFNSQSLRSLKYITYGASPTPTALLEAVMERLPRVKLVQCYGMTEASPVATVLDPHHHRDKALLTSAGRAALSAQIRIVGPEGKEQKVRVPGEIVISGPMIMEGYWRDPAATEKAIRNGWYYTGDIGLIDENGFLFVVDRIKDMIISGGENIYSIEVEDVIAAFPGIAANAVIGIPHPKWGESVHAVVVPTAGSAIDLERLDRHCRDRLAAFKCPRSYTIRPAGLPLSGANKVLKNQLRAEITRIDNSHP